jgi:hypothetical protein
MAAECIGFLNFAEGCDASGHETGTAMDGALFERKSSSPPASSRRAYLRKKRDR